ncbi:MAG TPA: alanine racemase, partial [Thermodesulfobacteriota bacterium]
IDINSLKSNFLQVKRTVGREVSIVSIVKADAYGHGSVKVSKALIESGSNMLGVATVEEALEIRESGISTPIIILGGIQPDEVETVIKSNFTPSLFSMPSAQAMDKYAGKLNDRVVYHLKVDTGMNRLGIGSNEIFDFLKNIVNLRNLELEGVFTHFANADGEAIDPTIRQIEAFYKIISLINQAGLRPKYIHSANSAAIQRFPQSHMSLVRPGIMLYGAGRIGDVDLKPVMRLKTRIIQVKNVPVGTPVSYGGTFVASRPTVIATLPIGYADGYMRRLSNRSVVSIKGFTAPVVGIVCMDLTMIDVTDIPNVYVGDEVVLFGDDRVSAENVAGWANTISYEVFSIIGKRVRRVYT